MARRISTLASLCAALALAGCAASGLTGEGPARGISPVAAQTAAKQHPQVVEEFGGAVTGPVATYVESVGRRVAAQSGIQQGGASAYTFTVLNTPVPNAFAVPGGYVYVTRGLLALVNDEAELASVLGHEIGHIAADHSKTRQDRGLLGQLGAAAVAILTGSSELGQAAGTIGQGLVLGYSRSQEYEADALGARYIASAGYDATASASFLATLGRATTLESRLQGRNDDRAIPSWARTHPLSEDRVARARTLASQLQPTATGQSRPAEYLRAVDGIIYGDDPRQGVVEGRRFLHPVLRLGFTAPAGFALQNGTRNVTISGNGGQALFSGGGATGDLSTYIAGVYRGLAGGSGQVSIPQPTSTTINGLPAAHTTLTASTQQGRADVSVIAYRWDSNSAYHFVTVTPAGSGFGPFASMIRSLDRLSADAAARVRPRVIDVVTVAAGDTIPSLARRMAYDDHRLERFLVLNGLKDSDRLTAGDRVKIVVYGR